MCVAASGGGVGGRDVVTSNLHLVTYSLISVLCGKLAGSSSILGSTSDIIDTEEFVVSVSQCLTHTPPTWTMGRASERARK